MRLKDLNIVKHGLEGFTLDSKDKIVGIRVFCKGKGYKLFKVRFNQSETYFINLIAAAWEAQGRKDTRKAFIDALGPEFKFKLGVAR